MEKPNVVPPTPETGNQVQTACRKRISDMNVVERQERARRLRPQHNERDGVQSIIEIEEIWGWKENGNENKE